MSEPKELKQAKMDQPIHTPETGTYGPELSIISTPERRAVKKMTQLENDVLVELPYNGNPKKTAKLLISNTRFTHRVLAD